jgi:hypothetical protein
MQKREKHMSNHDNIRVLSRLGARELAPEEIATVGGAVHTEIFTFGSDVTGDGHPEINSGR